MQEDFHYYATYCAAYIAGYSIEECRTICYSAQFVDYCSKTLLLKAGARPSAATTQLQLELMDTRTDKVGLRDITRIWSAFHFLPANLYAAYSRKATKSYLDKYRLICGPNGKLVARTVELAKDNTLQAVGIAMHVLADTWAHRYFAGTPSLVINNTTFYFYELYQGENGEEKRPILFNHNPGSPDDIDKCHYTNSLYRGSENSIMNLGHGRAGHLPDYSFITYEFMPPWAEYDTIIKDNPSDYYNAFCQMVYAMKYLRGDIAEFSTDTYAFEDVAPYETEIKWILKKRQLDSCDDWRAFCERLTGSAPEKFYMEAYLPEYTGADSADKPETFLGKFTTAAIDQKSMVAHAIYDSGSMLAGTARKFKRLDKADADFANADGRSDKE